jgi:Glycine zipper
MRKHTLTVVAGCVALSAALGALAQQPIIYPAKGQSAAQQNRDEGECSAWAKQRTGVDPVALAASPPPVKTGPAVGGGQRAVGAAGGALGGLAIGAIAGNAGRGAAIGAVVGTMAGGRQARQSQAAQNQQAVSARQQSLNTYNRAFSACLEGRGYTIK